VWPSRRGAAEHVLAGPGPLDLKPPCTTRRGDLLESADRGLDGDGDGDGFDDLLLPENQRRAHGRDGSRALACQLGATGFVSIGHDTRVQ
jgi:hypothetical protein